ncbi:hypothetical protein HY772_06525 [Candidatus Woesearchaeota archaeon]|nr:hypothetical protein [Candidatus Woesearchaeota archaeon]
MTLKKTFQELNVGVEELFLVLGIIIGFADFFSLLPPEIEYTKTLVSWISLGYLFYSASFTKILLGERHKKADLAILASFFLLATKDLVGFILSAIGEASALLLPFYRYVLAHAAGLEKITFIIGAAILIATSISMVRYPVRKPSVLHLIHEEEQPAKAAQYVIRFFSAYFLLLLTFIMVFNLAIEWLAISADSPLLFLLVFFYFFFILKHHKRFEPDTFIHKIGSGGESFYEHVITMFQNKRAVFLAISGLLALHILTDAAHFIVPYATTLKSEFYFSQLGAGHEHLWKRFFADWATITGANKLFSPFIYAFNIIAAAIIFISPGYLWHQLSKERATRFDKIAPVFFGTLTTFIMLPVIKFQSYASKNLVGVDILTHTIQYPENITMVFLISALIGFAFHFLAERYGERVNKLTTIIILAYFSYYIWLFFVDSSNYYIVSIIALLKAGEIFLGTHLFFFFAFIIIFYIGGLIIFIAETLWRRHPETFKYPTSLKKTKRRSA